MTENVWDDKRLSRRLLALHVHIGVQIWLSNTLSDEEQEWIRNQVDEIADGIGNGEPFPDISSLPRPPSNTPQRAQAVMDAFQVPFQHLQQYIQILLPRVAASSEVTASNSNNGGAASSAQVAFPALEQLTGVVTDIPSKIKEAVAEGNAEFFNLLQTQYNEVIDDDKSMKSRLENMEKAIKQISNSLMNHGESRIQLNSQDTPASAKRRRDSGKDHMEPNPKRREVPQNASSSAENFDTYGEWFVEPRLRNITKTFMRQHGWPESIITALISKEKRAEFHYVSNGKLNGHETILCWAVHYNFKDTWLNIHERTDKMKEEWVDKEHECPYCASQRAKGNDVLCFHFQVQGKNFLMKVLPPVDP